MIKRGIKKNIQGQTALILILLAAAALVFLSITLNWGRIAQTKTMLSIAANQAASLLASDVASYGEMEKQTNLNDTNEISDLSGIIMDLIMVVAAIIILIITIYTCGAGAILFAVLAAAMAVVNLVLQLAVVQPGMCALWNSLQKNQPIQQQFYEGGVGAALQGAITDQVNITDYFDDNTNGLLGITGNIPNDSIGRFAFFYTERLKMLNAGEIPQVKFFYNQLMEFMGGETCYQNFVDNSGSSPSPGVPINPSCIDPSSGSAMEDYCGTDPLIPSSDPACQAQIPNFITCAQNVYEYNYLPNSCKNDSSDPECIQLNMVCSVCNTTPLDPSCQLQVSNQFGFQLNDSCVDSDPSNAATYNPSCDSCCQPVVEQVSPASGSSSAAYKDVRPASCYSLTGYPASCAGKPNAAGCNCYTNPSITGCAAPSQCTTNNPYNSLNPPNSYPYIYDSTYQEYANGVSFLDQFGRDEQIVPTGISLPLTSLLPQGSFPNGIYPFFWLMTDYGPEVDNINPMTTPMTPSSQDLHWCAPASLASNKVSIPSSSAAPTGFSDLAQLSLSYTCQGQDCCVNYLPDSLTGSSSGQPNAITITVGSSNAITITSPAADSPYTVGTNASTHVVGSASENLPGTITGVTFTIGLQGGAAPNNVKLTNYQSNDTKTSTTDTLSFSGDISLPSCLPDGGGALQPGKYNITATATDAEGNILDSGTNDPVTIIIKNSGACSTSANACGTDSCGTPCQPSSTCNSPMICCPVGQTCSTPVSTTTVPGTCVVCSPSNSCEGMDCGEDSCGNPCEPETCTGQGLTCNPNGSPVNC